MSYSYENKWRIVLEWISYWEFEKWELSIERILFVEKY